MSFARVLIAAWLTAEFVRHEDGDARIAIIAIAALAWWLATADPLPAAIERGLEAFAQRYRR